MADVQLSSLGSVIKTAYEGELDTNAYTDAEKSKLTGIEASADVTDTANVTAAGALMDSEVTNLADVKSFDPADYATAAQGSTADTATQPGDSWATLDGTAWRVAYTNGTGDVTELALGADGTFLKSNGAAAAPSFATPAGSGDVSKVGTPADNQVAVWTGDGTIEGTSGLTYTGSVMEFAGGLLFNERADHAATPGAGKAEVWVNNAATQQLVFTDDTGADRQLLDDASGSALAAKAAPIEADGFIVSDSEDADEFKISTGTEIIAGLGLMQNLVDDTTPQLGGQLDVNGNALGDGTLELVTFTETASAVNQVNVANAATGGGPTISAAGDDTNIDLVLAGKGTGIVKGADIVIPVAISDETTALTTGTGKLTYYMPRAFTLTGIHACVTTAPVGSSLIIDVNDGGTSIMTTNKLVIDAGENDTTTAATAPTLTDTALAAGAAITFDIDQVGSSTAGAGAKVTLMGYWT